MRINRFSVAILTCLLILLGGCAAGPQRAALPEEVGLSSQKLAELKTALQQDVDQGVLAGAVVLLSRHGKIAYFESVGFRDREANVTMTKDAIFRIASMTKPIVAFGTMILVEEGRLGLSDPVSKYLPEFGGVQVSIEHRDASGQVQLMLEAPQRPITVQDLLQHTSGLTYGIYPNKTAVQILYDKANLFDENQTNAQFVSKLAKLPLKNHPGVKWEYSMSMDVMGRIIEVVSGKDLESYLKERVLVPLKMYESGFWIDDPGQRARLAQPTIEPKTGKRPGMADNAQRKAWASGGGGMVSTAMDYARFSQFLLNGGELDGVRLVSEKTFKQMLSPHVPAQGQSFGWGFLIRTNEAWMYPGTVGDFFWAGFYGTYFWVDPKRDFYAIFMSQVPAATREKHRKLMRERVYGALLN